MGIKVNNKEYEWGTILLYAVIAYSVIKGLMLLFESNDSDCIKYGMKEYGYSYEEAKEACDDAKSDALDR